MRRNHLAHSTSLAVLWDRQAPGSFVQYGVSPRERMLMANGSDGRPGLFYILYSYAFDSRASCLFAPLETARSLHCFSRHVSD